MKTLPIGNMMLTAGQPMQQIPTTSAPVGGIDMNYIHPEGAALMAAYGQPQREFVSSGLHAAPVADRTVAIPSSGVMSSVRGVLQTGALLAGAALVSGCSRSTEEFLTLLGFASILPVLVLLTTAVHYLSGEE